MNLARIASDGLARSTADGSLVPLAEQHRDLWNAAQIAEGVALISCTLGKAPVGPYQLPRSMNPMRRDSVGSAEPTRLAFSRIAFSSCDGFIILTVETTRWYTTVEESAPSMSLEA